jgi:hypothetical protein
MSVKGVLRNKVVLRKAALPTQYCFRAKSSVSLLSSTEAEESETKMRKRACNLYYSSVRLTQPDKRNWAIQKKSGDMWLSQWYQTNLDDIIKSFIRHSLNGEFRASPEKISDLKDLRKLILATKASLEESFKAIIVEKVA